MTWQTKAVETPACICRPKLLNVSGICCVSKLWGRLTIFLCKNIVTKFQQVSQKKMQVIKNWEMDFDSVPFSIHGHIGYNVMFIIYLVTLIHTPERKFGFLNIGLRGGGFCHEITKVLFRLHESRNTPDNMTTACWKKVENDSNEAKSKCFTF